MLWVHMLNWHTLLVHMLKHILSQIAYNFHEEVKSGLSMLHHMFLLQLFVFLSVLSWWTNRLVPITWALGHRRYQSRQISKHDQDMANTIKIIETFVIKKKNVPTVPML